MVEPADTIDLTGCEREPIHELGAIQPFGFLVCVDKDWRIERLSDNVERHIGRPVDALLGEPLGAIFGRHAIHELRNLTVTLYGSDTVERLFGLALIDDAPDRLFDCAVHRSGQAVVIEIEPSKPANPAEAAGLMRSMMNRLDLAADLPRFLQLGARQLHGLTGFDRVMVYKFHADGSGDVVAEVVRSGIEPLLGLRYPASDIPSQARALYLRTPFRIISDIDAIPAAIVPARNAAGEPLDLSLSVLRAVSPIHIVYLRNMGVSASLSVSIVVEGRLWGLFACHHYSPRRLPFELRTLAELFGQLFAMRLESRERRIAATVGTAARETGDRLMVAIAEDVGLLDDPTWLMNAVFGILPCDGVAIALKGRRASSGHVPSNAALDAIARHLDARDERGVFATDHLAAIAPMGRGEQPAGMLALPISPEPGDYVMLFRRPRVETVTWAGNPHKPVSVGEGGATALSPRASFAAWREEVRDRSEPFSDAELAMAETLRASLVEVVLRLANAAVVERHRANLRQEVLIAELNHRVRNILTLISGLVRQSRDPAIGITDYVDLLEGRIQSLARAHDQITRDNWGPAPLSQLIEGEAAPYLTASRLRLAGEPVMLEPLAFSSLTLVIHELITNSAKHGALSQDGRVDVAWTIGDDGDLILSWIEQDGPPVVVPGRRGLGMIIIEHSIPHDLGGRAEVTYPPAGLQAHFTIPSQHVRRADPVAPPHAEATVDAPDPLDGDARVTIAPILLLEDSLLIALHLEDILNQLGATRIAAVATVAQALAEIERRPPAIAILDFNLGAETSLPVADHLQSLNIPFVFATGYGDALELPERLAGVTVLQKPYNKARLATLLGDFGA